MIGMSIEERIIQRIRRAGREADAWLRTDPLFLAALGTNPPYRTGQVVEIAICNTAGQVQFASHVQPCTRFPGSEKLVNASPWPLVIRQLAPIWADRPIVVYYRDRTASMFSQMNEPEIEDEYLEFPNRRPYPNLWRHHSAEGIASQAFCYPGERISFSEAADIARIELRPGAAAAAQATAKLVMALAAAGQLLEAERAP
jgi:hypothetical protein